jgi:hypothetical protein
LKNKKFKEEIQTAWSKDTSYSCRSFIIFLDLKNDRFWSNSVSNQLQQKKNRKKLLLLGFLIFRILLLKIPFQRAHTLVIQKLTIFKNLSKFSRAPSLKIIKKKFKQAPLTTWTEHTSCSCCSMVIFLDF